MPKYRRSAYAMVAYDWFNFLTRLKEAMNETFLLTNIAPQVGEDFNRHYWAGVENWCRKLTSSFQDVYVFTVPLYLPKLEPDGKWRVVSVSHEFCALVSSLLLHCCRAMK